MGWCRSRSPIKGRRKSQQINHKARSPFGRAWPVGRPCRGFRSFRVVWGALRGAGTYLEDSRSRQGGGQRAGICSILIFPDGGYRPAVVMPTVFSEPLRTRRHWRPARLRGPQGEVRLTVPLDAQHTPAATRRPGDHRLEVGGQFSVVDGSRARQRETNAVPVLHGLLV